MHGVPPIICQASKKFLNKESNLKRELQENWEEIESCSKYFTRNHAGTRVSYQTSSSVSLGFNKNEKKELVFGLYFLLGKYLIGKEIQMASTYHEDTVDPYTYPRPTESDLFHWISN